MTCNNYDILIIRGIISSAGPDKFLNRIVIQFLILREIAKAGMNQQILLPVYLQLNICFEITYKLKNIFYLFLRKL